MFRDLDASLVDTVHNKVETLKTAFFLRYTTTYEIEKLGNEDAMLFSNNFGGSPDSFTSHAAAKERLAEKDVSCLALDRIERPSTKWLFLRWVKAEVRAILTKQTLLRNGRLPNWLRNKKRLYALDNFDDNQCLFCRLAVQGLRPDRRTGQAKMVAGLFYFKNPTASSQVYRK